MFKYIKLNFHELLTGSAIAFAVRILGVAGGLLTSLFIARTLGPEGAGVYFLMTTMVVLASQFGRLGLDNALVRYISQHAVDENYDAVDSLWRQSMATTVVVTVLLAGLIWLFRQPLANIFFDSESASAYIGVFALAITPAALTAISGSALTGLKRIAEGVFLQSAALIWLTLPLLVWFVSTRGLAGAAWAYTIGAFATLPIGIWLWRRSCTAKGSLINGHYRQLMGTAIPLLLIGSMSMLMRWADTLMIGAWLGQASVGLYNIAFQIAGLFSLVLLAVASIAGPKFSELWHQRKLFELEREARFAALIILALVAPAFIIVMVFAKFFLGFFGPEFVEAAPTLQVLVIGQFLNAATGAVGVLLVMTGYEKIMRNIIVFSTVVNIALNVVLIPRYGIFGAAVASAFSFFLLKLLAAFYVYRKAKVSALPYWPRRQHA